MTTRPPRQSRPRFVRCRPSCQSWSLLPHVPFHPAPLHGRAPPRPSLQHILLALIHFVCFLLAPYLMRCKSSVRPVHPCWFIHASSLSRLEWALMFHDWHPTSPLTHTLSHLFEDASFIAISPSLLLAHVYLNLLRVLVFLPVVYICVEALFARRVAASSHSLHNEVLMKGSKRFGLGPLVA